MLARTAIVGGVRCGPGKVMFHDSGAVYQCMDAVTSFEGATVGVRSMREAGTLEEGVLLEPLVTRGTTLPVGSVLHDEHGSLTVDVPPGTKSVRVMGLSCVGTISFHDDGTLYVCEFSEPTRIGPWRATGARFYPSGRPAYVQQSDAVVVGELPTNTWFGLHESGTVATLTLARAVTYRGVKLPAKAHLNLDKQGVLEDVRLYPGGVGTAGGQRCYGGPLGGPDMRFAGGKLLYCRAEGDMSEAR